MASLSEEPRPTVDAERELLEAIVDQIGALMVLEPDGRIVRFNAAAEELTGLRAADVIGRDMFETGLIAAERAKEVREAFSVTMDRGRHERSMQWYEGRRGRVLIGWRGTAIKGADGQVHHIVVEGL